MKHIFCLLKVAPILYNPTGLFKKKHVDLAFERFLQEFEIIDMQTVILWVKYSF